MLPRLRPLMLAGLMWLARVLPSRFFTVTKMSDFNFPDMTPQLRAYLDHPQRPAALYHKKKDGKPDYSKETAESKAARDEWAAEYDRLKAALPEGLLDSYYKAKKVWLCRDETVVGDAKRVASPCGKYHFMLTSHTTGKGTWNYSKARVYTSEGSLITTVCRNYGSFPHAWIPEHANGHAYLICGEDYQGQTVIELDTGKRVDSLPKGASQGHGFCWAAINPSKDGTLLAVEGCYWACPYEVIIVDIADPMNPPWLVLDRDAEDHFGGWSDDHTCQIGRRWEAVDLPGHPLDGKSEDDCTIEEMEEVEKEAAARGLVEGDCEAGWKEVTGTHTWTRPSNFEMCKKWLKTNIVWRAVRAQEYHRLHPDIAVELDLLWNRLTADEQKAITDDETTGPQYVLAREWASKIQPSD